MPAIWSPIWILVTALILGNPSHYIGTISTTYMSKFIPERDTYASLDPSGAQAADSLYSPNERKSLFVSAILVHDVDHGISAAIRSESDLSAFGIP